MRLTRHRRSLVEIQADALEEWLETITRTTRRRIEDLRQRVSPSAHGYDPEEKTPMEVGIEFMKQWMADDLIKDDMARIKASDMRDRFGFWASDNRDRTRLYEAFNLHSPPRFGRFARLVGLQLKHSADTRYYVGYAFRPLGG